MTKKQLVATFLFLFSFAYQTTFAQSAGKILFIIDSIPVLTDPEPWNEPGGDDISDITVLKNKDSLKRRGWADFDGVIYIFTKAYRGRPDSIKKIPSLKQMVLSERLWYYHGVPYTGRYIDYYNNGAIQNSGILLNGVLNGEVKVYFQNGTPKSILHYSNGVMHGYWNDYYKNGQLMQTRQYDQGKQIGAGKTYFVNGQLQHEIRVKKESRYDTATEYYSDGRIRKMRVSESGEFRPSLLEEELNKHSAAFYSFVNQGKLKEANRSLYKIWRKDSSNIDTYFKEGFLAFHEKRFDEAIAAFSRALNIEPLSREALVYRGLARIKKHLYPGGKLYSTQKEFPLTLEDFLTLPVTEQNLVCADFTKAGQTDQREMYVRTIVPYAVLKHCTGEK